MKTFKKIKSKLEISPNDSVDGYFIQSSESECRRVIDSLKGKNKIIGVFGGENSFNRRAIETLKINYLISPERGDKKDTLKQRDSGLNHVLAKEAEKKGILIIVDLDEIRGLEGREQAKRISRLIQNVKICRKAKCSLKIVSFSGGFSEKEVMSFGFSLGMGSLEAKNSIEPIKWSS